MDPARRLELVEAENEALRARVEELEDLLFSPDGFVAPIEWRLTGQEVRCFAVLLARELATKAQIMSALYDRPGVDPADPKIVDVFICKLRRKLKPFEVRIETLWGQGHRLDPQDRVRLRGEAAQMRRAQCSVG